jgi:hypothetical protein
MYYVAALSEQVDYAVSMPTAASLPKHNHSANHKASGKDERERYRPLDLERMATMLPLEGN